MRTIVQMRAVLGGTQALECTPSAHDAQRYRWLEDVVRHIRCRSGLRRVVSSSRQHVSRHPRTHLSRR